MKIAVTENYLYRIIKALHYEDHIVGVPESNEILNDLAESSNEDKMIITRKIYNDTKSSIHSKALSLENDILFDKIKMIDCDALFMAVKDVNSKEVQDAISYLKTIIMFNKDIYLFEYSSVNKIFDSILKIGELVGKKSQAFQIVQRNRGQLSSLTDGFYERIKNKKVLVLKNVEPFECYGLWVSDLVNAVCAKNCVESRENAHEIISWQDIKNFNPDTIIVAPENCTLDESLKSFKILEKLPAWNELPAVIRTEVYFCDGYSFQDPLRAITQGSIYLVSCIAGLNAGDITKRDSYRRLRWVELMRHKI